jgi:hypothetical protein
MKWHRPLFRLELVHVNKSQSISGDSPFEIKTFVKLSKDACVLLSRKKPYHPTEKRRGGRRFCVLSVFKSQVCMGLIYT